MASKRLSKYAVHGILDNLAEIERYLGRVKDPSDLWIKWAVIDVQSIRKTILDAVVDDVEVEAPEKIEVEP